MNAIVNFVGKRMATAIVLITLISATSVVHSFDRYIHEDITREGLARIGFWLAPEVIIGKYSYDPDINLRGRAEYHFSNCCWELSVETMRVNLVSAVDFTYSWYTTGNESYRDGAYLRFGRALHISQDFFAHSNWIEIEDIWDYQLPNFKQIKEPPDIWFSAVSNKEPYCCTHTHALHGDCDLGGYNYDVPRCSGYSRARALAVSMAEEVFAFFEKRCHSKYPEIADDLVKVFREGVLNNNVPDCEDNDGIRITEQPTSIVVGEGQNASFSVAAIGEGYEKYQWQKDGQNLSYTDEIWGVKEKTLQIYNVKPSDQGIYSCRIEDDCDNVANSNPAELVISFDESPPTIVEQPQSQQVNAGETVSFSVSATGPGTLTYLWKLYNASGTGNVGTGPTLTIAFAIPGEDHGGDEGEYQCTVSNEFGSVVSSFATLEVIP